MICRLIARKICALAVPGMVALNLGACDRPEAATPIEPPAAPAPRDAAHPSAESEATRIYYARVEHQLLDQGLLRRDTAPRDVPFSARNLAANFVQVALYDEYARAGNELVARQTASPLRRWEVPVRMSLGFGPTIPEAERAKDETTVRDYAARLSRITGLPITVSDHAANFRIYLLNEDERRAFGPELRAIMPGIDETVVRTITEMPRTTYCLVFAFSAQGSNAYSEAIAIIRGEHPDLLRLSCYHEELAQGLGLANDSPGARPSIFNDDEEFALLTRQDEMMLRMLYDPRLSPGMTALEARPIVETLANELMGGNG